MLNEVGLRAMIILEDRYGVISDRQRLVELAGFRKHGREHHQIGRKPLLVPISSIAV